VHGDFVIGTAVPASPEGRQRQEGCGRWPKVRSPPAGNEKSFRVLIGASREEAPEEKIFLSRDAAPGVLRNPGERSGTR